MEDQHKKDVSSPQAEHTLHQRGHKVANKHMRRCPTSISIREGRLKPQWNTTLHQFELLRLKKICILTTQNAGQDIKQLYLLHTDHGN